MKFRPYPRYKDSGAEWLGEVPEHWELKKIKRLATLRSGEFITHESIEESGLYPVFGGNGLRGFTDSFTHEGRYVLIGRQGALCGNINYSNGKFWASEHAVVVTPYKSISSTWLGELFRAMNLNQYSVSSAQPGLAVDRIVNIHIPVAPLNEQIAIANFLDRETNRIDALIEEKIRFIELLKEKRQTSISHAITKGLDPTVKMKDSGVDWLGEVPAHWNIKKVKYLFEIRKRIAGEEGYPVLSITQRGIKVKDTISGEGQLAMDYSKYQFVEVGDFAMNHMDLLTGYVDISNFHGVTSPDYRVFALTDANSVDRYFLYLMQMGYKDKIFYSYGQGVANIGRWRFQTEPFNNFNVPYPNKDEQQQIVDFLDTETSKIDALLQETQVSIELLKEHRTALISAAVTGKIDVREAA